MKSELKIPMHELPPGAYEILRLWTTEDGHTFARVDLFPNKADEDPCHWGTVLALTVVTLSERIAKAMVPLSADVPAMDPKTVAKRIYDSLAETLLEHFGPSADDDEPDEPQGDPS
mgnify:CR=1 FL=1